MKNIRHLSDLNDSSNYDSDLILDRLDTAKVVTNDWKDVKKNMVTHLTK